MTQEDRLKALAQAVGADVKSLKKSGPDLLTNLKAQGPIIISHRGGLLAYPEQGHRGFRASANAGFPLEADVATTSDGVAIIMHDNTYDRTTTLTGLTSSKTYAQVAKAAVKPVYPGLGYDQIATLGWLLDQFGGRVPIFFDAKVEAASRDAIIREVVARGLQKSVVAWSSDASYIPIYAAAGLATGLITGASENWASLKASGANWIAYNANNLGATHVTAMRNAGIQNIIAWTAKTLAQYNSYMAQGADGVIVDDPWLTGAHMEQRSQMRYDDDLWGHFVGQTTTAPLTRAEMEALFQFSGPRYLGRRSATIDGTPRSIDLGFAMRGPNACARFKARFLPGAVNQNSYIGIAWAGVPNYDQGYDDSNTVVAGRQGAYTICLRRTGAIDAYHKNTAVTNLNKIAAPTTNLTTAVTQTSAWQEIEVRWEASNLVITNLTTGVTSTFAESNWRGEGRLFLINDGTNFEVDLSSIAYHTI